MIIPDKWLNDETCYTCNDVDLVYDKIKSHCTYVGEKVKYLNVPISFDIETTSFYDVNGNKTAIMYVWMIGVFGLVIMGRTWDEYMIAYNRLCQVFRTCGKKRHMLWFIHNASFDFQFVRKHHEFISVFATGRYAPLYALTNEGVEFRCSLRLSSLSLDKVAKNLIYHHINKMSGDMDYRLIRHTQTPLTDKEKIYCTHDVKVVCAYIAECITNEGETINTIPLTSTGYVRRDCRNNCFKSYGYHKMIYNLTLSPIDFNLCRNAFMGGYVHSNPWHTRKLLKDVASSDIRSSYPTEMVSRKMPMSAPKHAKINKISELKYYIKNYNCIFDITLKKVEPRYFFDYYLSGAKCKFTGNKTLSNGRVVYADELRTTITELDFDIIDYMYKYDVDNIHVHDLIYFESDYLPTPFVKSVVEYYKKKTELSDIPEQKAEYDKSKRNVNGMYGMSATNPIRDEVYYINNEWSEPHKPDIENAINKYNHSYTRFLYYPWAVYITAHARHDVWEAIIECGDDHVYTDTDSEKCLNYEKHKPFFDEYNKRVHDRMVLACKVHGINIKDIAPLNKYGKSKHLGEFNYEGTYTYFKTNGAKRYMYTIKTKHKIKGNGKYKYIITNDFHLTASGVNSKKGMSYLINKYHNLHDIFNAFDDELVIPSEYSGRLTHTYIDDIREGELTDYMGITAHYKELSSVHLEPSDYSFSMAKEFIDFIRGLEGGLFEL